MTTFPVQGPGAPCISPRRSAGMGYALPAAMGAKADEPERDCVAVCGDGGFAMT